MARLFCPTCRQEFESAQSPAMPFCSSKCKLIDLGRWLNEEHSVTVERPPELEAYRRDSTERETAD